MTTGEESENKNLAYYRQRFAALNVNKTSQRGKSMHQPIMLLSVIELIDQGVIRENRIYVSDDLVQTFYNYWGVLGPKSQKCGLHYPFWHLERGGFWHNTLKSGFNGSKPKTTNKLREAVEYASLDDELFQILQEPNYRAELIDTLVAAWFSSNRDDLGDILQVHQDCENATQTEIERLATAGITDGEPRFYLTKSAVRNVLFRKAVVHTYDYKCAFCRLKVRRTLNQSIVDGAHIKPFAKFFDSSEDNGISLCKNHHWAFDQGWFAIDDDYRIIVASDLEEESPNAKPMKDFHSETILLPTSEQYLPRIESLQWHRLNVFRA